MGWIVLNQNIIYNFIWNCFYTQFETTFAAIFAIFQEEEMTFAHIHSLQLPSASASVQLPDCGRARSALSRMAVFGRFQVLIILYDSSESLAYIMQISIPSEWDTHQNQTQTLENLMGSWALFVAQTADCNARPTLALVIRPLHSSGKSELSWLATGWRHKRVMPENRFVHRGTHFPMEHSPLLKSWL